MLVLRKTERKIHVVLKTAEELCKYFRLHASIVTLVRLAMLIQKNFSATNLISGSRRSHAGSLSRNEGREDRKRGRS